MPRILIADDNTNIQKMVSLAFQESGIEVLSVGNGEAAVRRLGEVNPDLVLADIFMPVRNGYEVCEYVKKDQRFSHLPVILLVGAFDPLDEKEARRVGADGILKKPFVPPDPLIAMVMSALEKNPKIAAELAKAKAAKEVIPEPVAPAVPEPEVLLKREVKPLPEFPEPTAEEAALVYGFGSGRRTLGDDAELPAADQVPVAAADEASDEEESHIGTSHDWRRAAADFEVPDDIASQPAFPSDQGFGAEFETREEPQAKLIEFRAEVKEERSEPVAAKESVAAAHWQIPVPEAFPEAAPQNEIQEVEGQILQEPAAPSVSIAEQRLATPMLQEAAVPEVVNSEIAEPETLAQEAPVVKAPSQPESGKGSNVRHWMDALTAGPSSILGSWVDSLKKKHEPAKDPAPAVAPAEQSIVADEPAAAVASAEAAAVRLASADHEQSADTRVTGAEPSLSFPASEPSTFEEDPSAADRTQVEAWPAEPLHFDAPSAPKIAADAERAPDLIDEPRAVRVAPEPLLDSQDGDETVRVFRDPSLVEPEPVHVRPEPILENDETTIPTSARIPSEELAPAYSFFRDEASSLAETSVDEFSERIPTGPPPNREALAGIPFLTPPADFRAEKRQEMDPETVDAIVQRVVEKLAPQLQELLSQNMKPLVENLIQSELAKKD